jgi:hypothetical protein
MKSLSMTLKAFLLFFIVINTMQLLAQNQKDTLLIANTQKQSIDLSKTNENHQLLASLNGKWSFTGRHIPADTSIKPIEIFGTFSRKGIWENRYFISETSSGKKIKMSWADGREITYHDMYIDGYDNIKGRFYFVMAGNHQSTGLLSAEGSYDPATKTFTYETEKEQAPGQKMRIHILVKIIDRNHYMTEWHWRNEVQELGKTETYYTRIKTK